MTGESMIKAFGVLVGLLCITAGLFLVTLGVPDGPGRTGPYPNSQHVSTIPNPPRR
jgi:hypothetical protein